MISGGAAVRSDIEVDRLFYLGRRISACKRLKFLSQYCIIKVFAETKKCFDRNISKSTAMRIVYGYEGIIRERSTLWNI